jgi:hypothetical protein
MFNNLELNRQYTKINNLIILTKGDFPYGEELQAHLAKFLCILCSGFLENAIKITLTDFAIQRTSDEMILAYVKTQLQNINNPNSKKIREIMKVFHLSFEERLSAFMQIEDRSSAVNYIITDRHKIAHGKDSDITIRKIELYFKKVVEIFVFIEQDLLVTTPII